MRIAITEDEDYFANQLQAYLEQYAKEHGLTFQITRFESGAKLLGDYKPQWDLILMDIDMPDVNGMQAAQGVREVDASVLIMFVTNLAQYAIKGYEVNAVDYVLKPIAYPAFCLKMDKIMRLWKGTAGKYLMVKSEGEVIRMPLDHIFYIEVQGHALEYHTSEGVFGQASGRSMSELEDQLSPDGFCRVSASAIVNLRYVDSYTSTEVKTAGTPIALSRSRRKAFQAAVENYVDEHL